MNTRPQNGVNRWEYRHDRLPPGADPGAPYWQPRADRGGRLREPKEQADGSIQVEGYAARPGILVYRDAEGRSWRELVTADVLQESRHTLSGATLTLEHPPEMISPDNVATYSVGNVSERVELDADGFVEVGLRIRRRDAINAVKGGKQELSPGYIALVDPTPGVHPVFGPYDTQQKQRIDNHLAIVDAARAGSEVRIRMDGIEPISNFERNTPPGPEEAPGTNTNNTPGPSMDPKFATVLALLGLTQRYDTDEAATTAIAEEISRRDAAHAEALSNVEARAQTAEAERDQHKTRADAAEGQRDQLQTEAAERADAAALEELAPLAAFFNIDTADHTRETLSRKIAEAHKGSEIPADKGPGYVEALLEGAEARRADGAESRARGRSAWDGERRDSAGGSRPRQRPQPGGQRPLSPTEIQARRADSINKGGDK